MKRMIQNIGFVFLLAAVLPLTARAETQLIPVGQIIGLELGDDTVTVAAFDEVLGGRARDAGLRIGDEIVEIDDRPICCAEDIRAALRECDEDVEITVLRGAKRQEVHMVPASTEDGPKLGIYLRQGIAGIGTVTFYDPETKIFGTLGHGVNNNKGMLLHMRRGSAYEAAIQSVQKGKSGTPGQLKAAPHHRKPSAHF